MENKEPLNYWQMTLLSVQGNVKNITEIYNNRPAQRPENVTIKKLKLRSYYSQRKKCRSENERFLDLRQNCVSTRANTSCVFLESLPSIKPAISSRDKLAKR